MLSDHTAQGRAGRCSHPPNVPLRPWRSRVYVVIRWLAVEPVFHPFIFVAIPLFVQLLGFPLDQLLRLGFATPVQFWCGWRFHRGAYLALRGGRWAAIDCLYGLCAMLLLWFGHVGLAACMGRVNKLQLTGCWCVALATLPACPTNHSSSFPCRANMDVLVSLGTNAAYIYSLLSIFGQRLHVRMLWGGQGRQ